MIYRYTVSYFFNNIGGFYMQLSHLELDRLLDLHKWQDLQDSLSLVTKLALITINYKGKPVTQHSLPRNFCKAVRDNPDLEQYCHKCDSRAGLESVKNNSPFIYTCHFGIIDIAIPISVNDIYIGALMAGQVHLLNENDSPEFEQIFHTTKTAILGENSELKAMYDEIPKLCYNEIVSASSMLFSLCNYIVDESLKKSMAMSVPVEYAKTPLISTIDVVCKNHSLLPAIEYIHLNHHKNISQSDMAKLCNMSTGHFSRLFAKETNTNFKSYVAGKKVDTSKHYLVETDMSITEISDKLGFGEPSYYIKTFKKYEEITPNDYRKYHKKSLR